MTDDAPPDEAEHRTIRRAFLTYSRHPSDASIVQTTDWVRTHTSLVCAGDKPPPSRWMWEWVLFLYVLELCGIAELRDIDAALQEDLLSQLNLPAWARNALPFSKWVKGSRAMKEGHAYAGMNIGGADRARSLTALVPALPPDALVGLQSIVDGALAAQAAGNNSGDGANPLGHSGFPFGEHTGQTGKNKTPPPHGEEGSRTKVGRHNQGRGDSDTSMDPPPAPPSNLAANADPLAELAPLCPLTPVMGRGKVNIVDTSGRWRTQVCAASSVVQLLCAEYKLPCTDALAADIAAEVQQWTSVPDGTHLEASDVWWVALKHLLPQGPWPGLVVVYAPLGHIQWDVVRLMRIPGPVDERLLMIMGDGRHFDPIWWQTTNGPKAAVMGLPGILTNVDVTLTPNIGPACGTLLLFRASYVGFLPFSPPGQGPYTGDHLGTVVTGNGDWRVWAQYAARRHRLVISSWESTAVVVLQCAHPMPPYPEVLSIAEGVNMLAPFKVIPHRETGRDASAPLSLIIFAFDSGGCHVGTLPPPRARDALTWLRNPAAPWVALGHPGP